MANKQQIKPMKIHNFSAGPSILPQSVFEKAAKAVIDFEEMGLSILEISHRSSQFIQVVEEAISLVEELLQLPAHYKTLFLSGGASSQFLMVPSNLLKNGGKAGYIDTGTWASKAMKEAKFIGDIEVLASSKDSNYNYIPKAVSIPSDLDYVHITTNNTIFGTQYKEIPASPVPLVADMSSDFLSKPMDITKFGLVYAGAQKNVGPAGTVLAIVDENLLGKTGRQLPSMLDYAVHIKNESMYNTPPVFPIYVSLLVLRWIKSIGGLEALQQMNEEKAALLYKEIDSNPLFYGTTVVEDRSLMNACFLLHDENLSNEFLQYAESQGISGIKGHRSVGGFRVSIYNSMPKDSVQVLVDVMNTFAQKRG